MKNETADNILAVVKKITDNFHCYIEVRDWPACVAISTGVLGICGAIVGCRYVDKKYTFVHPEFVYEGAK